MYWILIRFNIARNFKSISSLGVGGNSQSLSGQTMKLTESREPLASLLLIAPFFLWGTAMVAMKGVIPQTTPLFMAGVRLVPAGVLVLLFAALTGRSQPRSWLAWLWIGVFALVDGALFQGFLAAGLVRTDAGLGSVMIDSQPLAVALLSLWLFGEKIGLWGWLGLAVGVLGISLIGLPDEWIFGLWHRVQHWGVGIITDPQSLLGTEHSALGATHYGEWLMLLAALSMAVGTIVARHLCRYVDPVIATGWHLILGGLPLFALSAVTESQQWVQIDLAGWMALSYSTVFGSAIAYGLFFYFASSGSLTSLSSLTFLTPVFALLFGNLFLSEMLESHQWMGVGLTLVSIYLVNQRDALAKRLQPQVNQGETSASLAETATETQRSVEPSALPLVKVPVQVRESESERWR
jgi:drug/metabolite transporter (DMT)-like permease